MLTDYENKRADRGWNVPGLRAMQRFVEKEIPLAQKVYYREGVQAYNAKCAPYVNIDYASIEPGAVWVGDHHQMNLWIRHKNKWVRPWITAWLDMRSRYLVGFHLCEQPNQSTILIAFRRGAESFGPPESVRIDNGKDYDSEMFTGTTKVRRRKIKAGYLNEGDVEGIYGILDVDVSFSLPYHPQSKSIERFFDTLDRQFTNKFKTYCGKDSKCKPEGLVCYLNSQRAVDEAYNLDGLNKLLTDYVEVYNNSAHVGAGMEVKSPAAVLAGRNSKRVLQAGVLDLVCNCWSGKIRVTKNGIRLNNVFYGHYDPEIIRLQGRDVRVSYDPADLSVINVFDGESLEFITTVEKNSLAGYGVADVKEAIKQKKQARKAAKQYIETRKYQYANVEEAAICARAEQQQPKPEPAAPRFKPVKTPLDDQVEKVKSRQSAKKLKKAAGAEHDDQIDLNINYDALLEEKRAAKEGPKLNFWGPGGLFRED